jgi:hypothetical protein
MSDNPGGIKVQSLKGFDDIPAVVEGSVSRFCSGPRNMRDLAKPVSTLVGSEHCTLFF